MLTLLYIVVAKIKKITKFGKKRIWLSKRGIASEVTRLMNLELFVTNPDIFFERELSWLNFNERVLEEAEDDSNPLMEKLRFLCITESNMDEFYMVRVAGHINDLKSVNSRLMNGMSKSEMLHEVSTKVRMLVERQYSLLTNSLLPNLKEKGINILLDPAELTPEEILFIDDYYKSNVAPILTPLAIDISHPFPHILNKTLNLAISLNSKDKTQAQTLFAIVQVPSVLPRFFKLPTGGRYILLEQIIKMHLSELFFGMEVTEAVPFRIIRDADISIEKMEDTIKDLLTSVKNELKNRIWGEAVRLDIQQCSNGFIKSMMQEMLDLNEDEIYVIPGIINLVDLNYFYNIDKRSSLKFHPIQSRNVIDADHIHEIFSIIRKKDQLFHHPYESFQVIEDLLARASEDPKVLAIKMTLYRTSGDSMIIQSLEKAAENGKQVTVLVELTARFDEERNVRWAQRLEDAGVHVVYGIVGLKIHSKMLLIVRKEGEVLKRYVHLGTGNYNSITSRFYTDLSLLTVNPDITEDVAVLFNAITSFERMPQLKELSSSPSFLKDRLIQLIRNEAENAKNGNDSGIVLKVNSISDPDIILELYKASCAGVKIDMIIRGICCIKPGIPGLSENIKVISVVGMLLEHSRIYIFNNNNPKDPLVYLASADCMPRSFLKRIEVMFPILDKKNKERVLKIVKTMLSDNTKARMLHPDGAYTKVEKKGKNINAHLEMSNI